MNREKARWLLLLKATCVAPGDQELARAPPKCPAMVAFKDNRCNAKNVTERKTPAMVVFRDNTKKYACARRVAATVTKQKSDRRFPAVFAGQTARCCNKGENRE